MGSQLRIPVWAAVIAASGAVGYYLKSAPSAAPTPAAPTTPAQYVFVAGGADPYWELCVAGAREAAARLGATVDVRLPADEGDAGLKEQMQWLGELARAGIDGVALGPIDAERETTLINSLAEKTTVIAVDSDAPQSRRMFYVGSSNYEAGGLAAREVREVLPDGGKVAVLLASLTKTNAAERFEGFQDALAESAGVAEYRVVETDKDQGDYDRCRAIIREALKQHPDLGAIVCTFGYHGPLALDELQKLDAADSVRLIAFDEDRRVLEAVEAGRAHATIVQDPFLFGAKAIEMLHDVRSGRYLLPPIAGRVDVGVHCFAVRGDNLADFRARMAQRLGAQEAAAE